MKAQYDPMPLEEGILSTDDLISLVQTSRELATRLDLTELLQEILSTAGQLTHSPDGSVLLYDSQRDSIYFAGAIGEHAPMLLQRYGALPDEAVPRRSNPGTVFLSGQSI